MPTNYNEQYRISRAKELESTKMGKKGSYEITVTKGTRVGTERVSGYIYYPFAVRKEGRDWFLDHVPTGLFVMSFKLKRDVVEYLKTIDRHVYDSADMSDRETMLAWGKLRRELEEIKFFVV